MARAVASDYLHNMRFHVTMVPAGTQAKTWLNAVVTEGKPQAGFNTCTTPDMTVEVAEYKEGCWVYTRKYPGNPMMGGDITLTRGVTRKDGSFFEWIQTTAEGQGEYRADVQILHFHREQALNRIPTDPVKTDINAGAVPARTYHLYQAFPTRHKTAGDMDAASSDISIMELDLSYENFSIETGTT